MSHYYKSNTELSEIGDEAFALLDGFSSGHKPKATSSVSSSHTTTQLFHSQYRTDSSYVVRHKVYVAPVQAMRNETVMDCYEAAKMFGGTVIVDGHKKRTTRWSFFKR
ncbi:hypothetical protein Tco_0785227 [Tanacetum coccineum]